MKVIHVDEETNNVFFRLWDGRTARLSGIDEGMLEKDDIVLSHDGNWTLMPPEVWPSPMMTSVIRKVFDDGTVLGESGAALLSLKNPRNLKLQINETVEIDGTSDITRILSNEPIRSRLHSHEDEIDPSSYLFRADDSGPTFADFGGYPQVVERAKELIETQLNQRDKLETIGARPIKGILFTGPPGTGKTHLARILAHESKADFYSIGGPAVVSKWLGDTEDTLRRIFQAAENATSGKAIIFFDEIDSIAEARTGDTHESSKRLVAQLLTLMDGFDNQKSNLMILAATNRADALDPALTRPGRFDWEVEFGMPTLTDRLAILTVGARKLKCRDDLPLLEIAFLTHNWSAAQLAAIWTEAALVAARDQRAAIASEDVAQAYERIAARPNRSSRNRDRV